MIRLLVGIVLVAGVVVGLIRCNLLFDDILQEVNRRLPKERAIPGYEKSRFFEVIREYRRLCPDAPLLPSFYIFSTIFVVCSVGFGIFFF